MKRKKLLSLLVLLMTAATGAWAETVTWSSTNVFNASHEMDWISPFSPTTLTYEDITISVSGTGVSSFKPYDPMGNASLDCYGADGDSFTFTAPSGKVFTKIEINNNGFINFTAYGDWTKPEMNQIVWSGTPASTVTLGGSNSTFADDINSIVFTLATVVASGTSGDVSWTLTGTSPNYTLTISGSGAMADYAGASGQPWASYRSNIKSVVVAEGVTHIGDYAFRSFSNLTSITLPDNLTSIGQNAFYGCRNLTSITLPDNLTSIGQSAFYYCSHLTSITIPANVKSIGNNAFDVSENLATVTLNSNPFIGESAFFEVAAVTMNLTANGPVNGAYWTTFYNQNYHFVADEHTQVFKVQLSDTQLTMHEVTDKITQDQSGYVLKNTTDGHIVMTLTKSATSDYFSSHLEGVALPEGKTADNPSTTYVLSYTAANGVGFYRLQAGKTLGVGKAYFTYSGGEAPERGYFEFIQSEEVTGIQQTEAEEAEDYGTVYDLMGRPVTNPAPGIYIVNGKKVFIK